MGQPLSRHCDAIGLQIHCLKDAAPEFRHEFTRSESRDPLHSSNSHPCMLENKIRFQEFGHGVYCHDKEKLGSTCF